MKLLIGLGNPGSHYEGTRHNIGFCVIDSLVSSLNAKNISKSSFYGELYRTHDTLFLKPTTYMNLSGKSVIAVKNFFKVEISEIIVVHDDLDLPFGALKFKVGGGSGGHNGLKSIDSAIGKEYLRIRMGIGKPLYKSQVSDYVLAKFTHDEQASIEKWIAYIVDTIAQLEHHSYEKIQSKYTLKSIEALD
ncbi:MAG: peptidyl-tRNA hydrolase [Sulfurovum sp. FS08-3]|nr:MAG: peptidyl-tRNA hydrolase [Sulfurovum sp. PC08-66]KIM12256.1 MAG: peptidyl-tRNA hydrolase [Sulfurovum sp. FS08-3]